MDWMESIRRAIEYIEDNITDELTIDSIAKQVNISPFYLFSPNGYRRAKNMK